MLIGDSKTESSMTTIQLTVIWYATLVVIGILVVHALAIESVYPVVASVLALASILVYSLQPHPFVRKSWGGSIDSGSVHIDRSRCLVLVAVRGILGSGSHKPHTN